MKSIGFRRAGDHYVHPRTSFFKEFPPSQKPGSFGIDQALEALQAGAQGGAN